MTTVLEAYYLGQQAALEEIEKYAGVGSEHGGMLVNPINWVGNIPAILLGLGKGPYRTKKEFDENDEAMASNLLIPGMAGYRAMRRALTVQKHMDDEARKRLGA